MAAESKHLSGEITAIRRADGESRTLAASLPRLVLEARRIAANVIHGLHGRRRAGAGETFWQYRRFVSGEPSQNVDWRRSARDDHLYVREQEWEAAHTVWLAASSTRWRRRCCTTMQTGSACRRPLCPRRSPKSWCCRISGRRSARSGACLQDCRPQVPTAPWCRSSIRLKKRSPIPDASSSSSRKSAA